MEKHSVTELGVWQIDRLGRDVRDILNTIYYFSQKGICIYFISQGLRTLDENGKENPITSMVIGMIGTIASLTKRNIYDSQLQGIAIAKAKKNVYLWRKKGSQEDIVKFLSKPKNKKAMEYLKKGFKKSETAKLSGLNVNTISKISKFINPQLTKV